MTSTGRPVASSSRLASRPGGQSARSVAAGFVRAAIDAGTAASRFPARTSATSPASRARAGITVTGTTPVDAVKLFHAERPAMIPSGAPTSAATTSMTLACQATTARTERVYPRNLIHYNRLDQGGHFAAWEQPQLFAAEMRASFRPLRRR